MSSPKCNVYKFQRAAEEALQDRPDENALMPRCSVSHAGLKGRPCCLNSERQSWGCDCPEHKHASICICLSRMSFCQMWEVGNLKQQETSMSWRDSRVFRSCSRVLASSHLCLLSWWSRCRVALLRCCNSSWIKQDRQTGGFVFFLTDYGSL